MKYEVFTSSIKKSNNSTSKKLAFIFVLLLAASCSLDQSRAKATVEALEQKINAGDYAATSQYYSEGMNSSESVDQRAEKFKKLHDVFGDFVSMECVSATNATDPNDQPCLNLEYKVKHTKMTSIEDFTIVSEGGSYKVTVHDIKQN
jgi:hypothetical protein